MGWNRFFSRGRRDRERAQELRDHFALLVDDHVARGVTRDEATRRARLTLGNPRVKREELDDMNRLPMLDTLTRDVRYALRMLRRSPAFAITSVITLALVIGGNAAVMSLADAILLRPLPYPHPERLARVVTRLRGPEGMLAVRQSQDGTSWEMLRDDARAVDVAITTHGQDHGVNIVVGNVAATVRQLRVSAGYFRVLGVAPILGREFTRDEDRAGGPAVAVVSYDFWRRQLASDPGIVGREMQLRGEPYTIVGVMPPAFVDPAESTDVWTPVRPSRTGEGVGTNYGILARVRDGYTWAQAEGELAALGRASFLARKRFPPGTDASWSLSPLQDWIADGTRVPIQLLAVAGAIVLVIACVNLAALLLARGGSRVKEIATRMALGSGRAAVVRQLIVESVVLGLVGGVAGIGVGVVCLEGLKALGGDTFVLWTRVSVDGRVVVGTLGLSLVTSVLFGVLPAWQAGRLDINRGLSSSGSRAVAGASAPWMRRALVAAEVALGVVVLVGAGLLVRTYANLRNLEPGFNPTNVMTASASLQDARYATSARINELFSGSLEALAHTPGVMSAAVSLETPYRRFLNSGFRFSDQPSSAFQMANVTYATPGFLDTLEIPLRAGRDLSVDDRADTRFVVIVNETFVRSWGKGANMVGRRIWFDGAEREIVGVFGDVKVTDSGIDFPGKVAGPLMTSPLVVQPAAQVSDGNMRLINTWFQPVWSVRMRQPMNITPVMQQAIGRFDPLLPVVEVQSLADVQSRAVSVQRLMMTLVGATALLALLLAVVGIDGLIAHGVAERTREIGIRLALGATTHGTIRTLALSGVAVAGIGAAAGVGLAWLAVTVFDSFPALFHVDKHDPMTFGIVTMVLIGVASIASVVPALRILRLDPATILRE